MVDVRSRMRPFFLAALSGVLGALCFPTYSLWPLVFVALVPLLLAVAGASRRRAFLLGWLTGTVGFLGAFSWVLPTIARFESISSLEALPFFALFVAYHALQLALFGGGVAWAESDQPSGLSHHRMQNHIHHSSFIIHHSSFIFPAACWILLEWAFPKVIPWSFGDTLAASAALRQGADVAGVYGLSFLVILVNATVAAAIVRRDMPLPRRVRPAAAAATLLAVAAVYGGFRISRNESYHHATNTSHEHEHALLITIVQGGLHSGRDDLVAANEEAWATYARLTEEALTPTLSQGAREEGPDSASFDATQDRLSADLIVWPETTLRVYLRQDSVWRDRLGRFIEQIGRPLFLGSLDLPADGRGELNSGYLVEPGELTDGDAHITAMPGRQAAGWQVYYKHVLLPFGEYVPGASWLPLLSRWRTTGRFVGAEASHPLTLNPSYSAQEERAEGSPSPDEPDFWSRRALTPPLAAAEDEHDSRARLTIPFGPSICFEAIWPGAYNQLVRAGAEFLVNITDDGWFGNTAGPYEHLNAARLRAVETRRWLVRASNSGVSAFIDPMGNIVDSLTLGAVGTISHSITPGQSLTPYVRYGDWPVYLSLVIIFGAWLVGSPSAAALGSRSREDFPAPV
jgi:apolipoprotein N-acyltransferase